jgi:ankyrin repeat protein
MVEHIIQRNPHAVITADNEGRVPLHYAAVVKDGGHIYNLLVEAGADENALDNVSTSSFYINKFKSTATVV